MQTQEGNITFTSKVDDVSGHFTLAAPSKHITAFTQAFIDHLNAKNVFVQPPHSKLEGTLSVWTLELHDDVDQATANELISTFKL